ncbi:MAG: glycosyltransferase [Bacteroidota bacterium]|nr:glycosyltransferase [Bacteroidota bacterium]
MKQPVSLIISFYNNIELLRIIFTALERQTLQNFEVIVADDGSCAEVVEKVHQLIRQAPFGVRHCWHEDCGWQKNSSLNEAIRSSQGDYLIFIDGDCIPHRCFVEEHYGHRQKGIVLTGRRVQLTRHLSGTLTTESLRTGRFERLLWLKLVVASLFQKNLQVENAIRIKRPFLRKLLIKDKEKGILGCNFSIHKADILLVNGFDERYKHPGTGEDTDLNARLLRAGIKTLSKKHLLTVYHIAHPRFDLMYQPNLNLLKENNDNNVTYTPYGIDKNTGSLSTADFPDHQIGETQDRTIL